MTVLPVVLREMSVLARRKSTYWSRTVTGLVCLLVMLWLLLVSRVQVSFSQMGASIFLFLSSLAFAFAVLAGLHSTSDSVSEEKREGTLGLLFLTDLRGWDVIGGKLAATSFGALLALMGIIPMLSLALLLGGVTLAQFGLVALVLMNTLFLSLAMGVFVSTVSENERKAMIGTFLGLLVVMFGPFLLSYALNDSVVIAEAVALSPLYAFVKLHSPMALGTVGTVYFWYSLLITHLLAWLLLFFSAHLLPRFVNTVPKKRTVRVRAFVENFVYGRTEERKKHRAELLDRNAFLWLASRERVKPKYAWGVVVFFVGLYWWISYQVPNARFDLPIVITLMFLVHLVLKIWAASEVCSRLIEDRRSGALELLLSTPLSVKEIADGQTKALGRLFLKPIVVLILLEIVLLYYATGWAADSPINRQRIYFFFIGLSTLLLDLWALKWVGLWLSLSGKSIERILVMTLARILTLPWLLFAVGAGILGATMFLHRHDPSEFEAMSIWWVIALAVSAWFGARARRNFLAHFRELAAKRFDAVLELEPVPRKEKTGPKRRLRLPGFYRRHPITAAMFTLLGAVLISLLLRGWYWEMKLDSEFARIRAAGFPATLQEIGSFAPPLPAGENPFAMLHRVGPVATGRPFFANRKTDLNLSAMEKDQFRVIIEGNEEMLAALWKLPEYEGGSLDLTKIDWTQYARQSSYVGLLEADALNEIFSPAGVDQKRLRKSILAMAAHARLLRMQPSSYGQQNAQEALTRLRGVLHFAFQQGGKTEEINEDLLVELQRKMEELEKVDVLTRTIGVQRALMLEIGRNPAILNNTFTLPKPLLLVQSFFAAIGSRDKQLVEMSQSYTRAIEFVSLPAQERLRLGTIPQNVHPSGNIMGIMWSGADCAQIFWNDATFVANRNLIRTALAAKRHALKYGKPPKELQELVPEFLGRVLEDPYTGDPLGSLFVESGLLIYSVGVDRIDNTAQGKGMENKADLVIRVK